MSNSTSVELQKWIKKCLKQQFATIVETSLTEEEDCTETAQKIIQSQEMSALLNFMRGVITEKSQSSKSYSIANTDSRPQTSASFTTELTINDWNSPKDDDPYLNVIDKISFDKPDHVRLAGYEILLKNELTNASNGPSWDVLQKTLRDGLMDDSKPIFEASLKVHARLLNSPQSYTIYQNLLSTFNAQYHSQNLYESLPTLISGINFKLFLHEKLFYIMYLIIRYQEEMLKSTRYFDKTTEEILEQFVVFLSTHSFGNSMEPKTLTILNILSVLEPRAEWSKKWMHSLASRRIFTTVLVKSPSLLLTVIQCVEKGFEELPPTMSLSIYDEQSEVRIMGDTVEALTYLHCLSLLSQLCNSEAGRDLLSAIPLETSFSPSTFICSLLRFLNALTSSEAPNGVYNVSCNILTDTLNEPVILYEPEFYDVALNSIVHPRETLIRIWPHTLLVMSHMLDTVEGTEYIISECKAHSSAIKDDENAELCCPGVAIVQHVSNVLRQPFSIINIEYVQELFNVLAKLLVAYNAYDMLQNTIQYQFYPAIAYFYNKLDKCFVENENKAQNLNSIVKKLLLKVVSIPFGLQALNTEPIIFEELLHGSIGPLRTSWTSMEIVCFVVSAGFFNLGCRILTSLAPHVLSTLLSETCSALQDYESFHDPWNHADVTKFLHILKLFSINLKCFTAFMTHADESGGDSDIPLNLYELLYEVIRWGSTYHHLSLLSLDAVIWNLDIRIYLQNILNFQEELLKLQEYCIFVPEGGDEAETRYTIDDDSYLRHKILINSYYVYHKRNECIREPEECQLIFSYPPPNSSEEIVPLFDSESKSELDQFLQESKPGLRDNNWISQTRQAYATSTQDLKISVLLNLLDQMQQATPTGEWADDFVWPGNVAYNGNIWSAEELNGMDLTLRYAEQNKIIKDTPEAKENLKQFLEAAHTYIKYEKPKQFEGFDWFLATVYIICEGNNDRCKTVIMQLVQFPSTMYLWQTLGKVIDKNNREEFTTQLTFSQMLETIISNELPNIKYGLKSTCGVDWWIICSSLMCQCFWGMLPWSEIMHYFAICILYPPDYILYYCVSLLYHCRHILLQDITNGIMWPENMALHDYQCHNYLTFMDNLEKRYRNRVLPMLTVRNGESTG